MIALPVLGYKSHISIDRRFNFIREMAATSASDADGRLLRQVVSMDNTGYELWADSGYRSKRNVKWLSDRMLTSRVHRRKPMGKPMSKATARANAARSSIRAHVEHVFAHQKNKFGRFIRTIGLARAEAKLTLCNLAYKSNRLIFHERRETMGCFRPRSGKPAESPMAIAETDPKADHSASGRRRGHQAIPPRQQLTRFLRVSSSKRPQ